MAPPGSTEARTIAICHECRQVIYGRAPDNAPARTSKLVWKHDEPAIDADHPADPEPLVDTILSAGDQT